MLHRIQMLSSNPTIRPSLPTEVEQLMFRHRTICVVLCLFFTFYALAPTFIGKAFYDWLTLLAIMLICIASSMLLWLNYGVINKPCLHQHLECIPYTTVAESLSYFGSSMNFSAILLLQAHQGIWVFVNGWNTSPAIGINIAKELQGKVPPDRQSEINVKLLDSYFKAVCTPLHLPNGTAHLLVTLDTPIYPARTKSDIEAIAKFSWSLSATLLDFFSSISNAHLEAAPSALCCCCSICDRVSDNAGKWGRWSSWLHDSQGISTTHTVCQDCCEKMYGLNAVTTVPSR